jgi:hypothetical protein
MICTRNTGTLVRFRQYEAAIWMPVRAQDRAANLSAFVQNPLCSAEWSSLATCRIARSSRVIGDHRLYAKDDPTLPFAAQSLTKHEFCHLNLLISFTPNFIPTRDACPCAAYPQPLYSSLSGATRTMAINAPIIGGSDPGAVPGDSTKTPGIAGDWGRNRIDERSKGPAFAR